MTANTRSVVVVGAGAAGIVAAGFAARAGAKVQLLERTKDGGRKILISGGGRCNILPSVVDPAQYVTQSSPNIVKQILRSWPLEEQRAFFEEELGIPLKLEEESGKLFPVSDKAREVRDGLLDWARKQGAEITFEVKVIGVRPTSDSGWRIATDLGEIAASSVILATGGLSVPNTGSDGIGLRILELLGHTIHPTHPALAPLTLTPHRYSDLAGISLPVAIRDGDGKKAFRTTGGFLVTHRGWSGPAALNVSHLTRSPSPGRERGSGGEVGTRTDFTPQPPLAKDLTPQPPLPYGRGGAHLFLSWGTLSRADWERELTGGTKLAANVLKQHLPERLAEVLFAESGVAADRTVAQLRKEERAKLLDTLTSWPLPYTGDEGYKKAEVTGGGVALAEIIPQTMESRVRPGLYICGEALDVFGPIGGYNFHWAWATGRLAGRAAGE
jgi:predicted flavoprotein YhiN